MFNTQVLGVVATIAIFVGGITQSAPVRAGLLEKTSRSRATAQEEPAKTEDSLSSDRPLFDYLVTEPEEPRRGRDLWYTKDSEPRFLDERIEPTLLLRSSFVYSQRQSIWIVDEAGQEVEKKSADFARGTVFGHRDGFVMDDAEIGLKGRFNDLGIYYKAKVEFVPRFKDGTQSSNYLQDAYAGWDRFSVLDLRVGNMKIPFSQANMKPTEDQALVNAPLLNKLSPRRQLGARLTLSDPWKMVVLQGGVYNSVKLVTQPLRTMDELLFVVRGELWPNRIFHPWGANPLDLQVRLGVNVAQTDNHYNTLTEQRSLGFDAMAHLWIFTAEAEVVFWDYYLSTGEAQRGMSWHADLTIHAWPGVVDLTGRVEELDGNEKLENGTNAAIEDVWPQHKRWITAGITVHLANFAKLQGNYVRREELEGIAFDNDMFVVLLQLSL